MAVSAACGGDTRSTSPDPPVEPDIKRLESQAEVVHPGDSIQLAVTAGPTDEDEGDTSGSEEATDATTQSQSLNHGDAAEADASGEEPVSDVSPITDASSEADTTSGTEDTSMAPTSDTGGMFNDTGGSNAPIDAGGSSEEPEPQPDPPSGDVPEDWEVSWSVESDDWSIDGSGATAELQAPDRYESTTRVEVTVTTPKDRSTSQSIEITTGSNTPPAITGSTTRPNPVEPAGQVDVAVNASDPNGDELEYTWQINSPWTIANQSEGEATIEAPDRNGVFATLQVTVEDGYGGRTSTELRLETSTNTPPSIASITASPPQVAPEGTLMLEADATDSEHSDLTYEWSIPDDWTASSTSGSTIEVTAPDRYDATGAAQVTVTDPRGAKSSGSVIVSTRENQGPTISTFDASPLPVDKGGTIDLEVIASDPNGDSLSYQWSVRDSSNWDLTSSGSEATLQGPDEPSATTKVNVVVEDAEGKTARASKVVSTEDNAAPTVASISANPPTVPPQTATRLTVDADDPDGDDLSYNWTLPSGWTEQQSNNSSPNEILLQAPNTYGLKQLVEVVITDGNGGSTKGSVFVSTTDNGAPTLSSLSANPSQVAPGGTTTLEASARDPNGDNLSYNWTLPGQNWTTSGSGASIDVTVPDQFGLSETIQLTVQDGNGGTAQGSVVVSTRENRPPTLNSLTADPQTVDPGSTTTLEVDATEPDGQNIDYNWNLPSNWTKSGQGASIDVTAPDQYGASGKVRLTLSDGTGGSTTGSIVLYTPDNQAPTVSSVTTSPNPAQPGASVEVEALASDPDGDSLSYDWTVPKDWSKSGSGAQITLTAPSSYDTTGTVEVTIEDGNGASAQGSTVVSTVPNEAPVLSALTANPQSVAPSGIIQIEATASDPNGDSLTYTWSPPQGWSVSGSGSGIELTAPDSYGESGLVEVTIVDGNGGQTTGSVLVRTARNQSPIISKVTAQPVVLQPGEATTVRADASDPDGDSISYSWSTPNNWTKNGSGDQTEVTAPNETNATATIEVTVSDGQGGSSTSAVVVQTINNQEPSIDSLSANPDKVQPGGTLTIAAEVSDPDGDSLSYSWSLNNQNWSSSGSGSSVSLQSPNDGDSSVEVTVTVNDSNGGTAESSITVETKSCPSNQGNCDGKLSNKCEVDLTSDDNNCGACGNVCSGNKYCARSSCVEAPTQSKVIGASATRDNWLSRNPYGDSHDGGFVYSPSQDALYSMYGNDNSGRNVYRIEHKNQTSSRVKVLNYGRHGSHPVIDEDDEWVYFLPSQETSRLERVKVGSHERETLATAPHEGTFSRGAYKDGKLWILLDDSNLHSYDPSSDNWNDTGENFRANGMVVANSNDSVPHIYLWIENSANFYRYNTSTESLTQLSTFPDRDYLGGNGQMEYIPSAAGAEQGFIYAVNGCSGDPRMYSISDDAWYQLDDPKRNGGCHGHATYDPEARRLYIRDDNDNSWYYQY